MNTTLPRSGLDLKVLRVQNRVKQKDIAAAMGVTSSRVTRIEAEGFPSVEMIARYVKALDTCRTFGASQDDGQAA